jgi:UDP-N-acetylglucosamine/UDP-N-acetyl-alpha-D-glucosaminouronate 4-epimerase
MSTKSLVTGGAGFIGSNLVRRLLVRGHEVTVLDNLSSGSAKNLEEVGDRIRFVHGDVRDRELLAQAFQGVDTVFHLAALPSVPGSIADPWTNNDVQMNGTLGVLLAARNAGARRVLYAASCSVYGDTEALPITEAVPAMPLSPYAVTKYAGELYCQVFYRVYGLETVALRYFNVFGPRQDPHSPYGAAIPRFISAMLRGERPTIYGDGEQTRDFVYVDNIVSANIEAALAPAAHVAGQSFNIGCGERISLNRLIGELQEIIGTRIEPIYAEAKPGDVRHSQSDITRAREAFGYVPSVGVREGLEKTVQWMTAQGE